MITSDSKGKRCHDDHSEGKHCHDNLSRQREAPRRQPDGDEETAEWLGTGKRGHAARRGHGRQRTDRSRDVLLLKIERVCARRGLI
ncbi:hypothetical protein ACOSQ3_021183 [Xanthoceras sorbifolium]